MPGHSPETRVSAVRMVAEPGTRVLSRLNPPVGCDESADRHFCALLELGVLGQLLLDLVVVVALAGWVELGWRNLLWLAPVGGISISICSKSLSVLALGPSS